MRDLNTKHVYEGIYGSIYEC